MPPEILIGASIVANVVGAFLVKRALNRLGPAPLNRELAPYFINLLHSPGALSGGLLILLAPFLYARALPFLNLSYAYSFLVAANMLGLLLFAVLFLGEKITPSKVFGTLCVLAGVVLLR